MLSFPEKCVGNVIVKLRTKHRGKQPSSPAWVVEGVPAGQGARGVEISPVIFTGEKEHFSNPGVLDKSIQHPVFLKLASLLPTF